MREVTYHTDGSVSTKGMDADFKPQEGSSYRKDARYGEYWTTPQGKQVWVDGESRVWHETRKGIWHSKDAVLTENAEYVKKGRTKATELDGHWSDDTVNGKEVHLSAKKDDFKIDEGNGKFYVVEGDVFRRTDDKAPA